MDEGKGKYLQASTTGTLSVCMDTCTQQEKWQVTFSHFLKPHINSSMRDIDRKQGNGNKQRQTTARRLRDKPICAQINNPKIEINFHKTTERPVQS
jgi:hypothetical protein